MKELLKIQEKLLKQGRGYDFQSHGTNAAGDEFYNFALFPAVKGKGNAVYCHAHTLEEIVEKIKPFMVENKIVRKPVEIEEEEEEEISMEDLL